jgi:transposase-like protein
MMDGNKFQRGNVDKERELKNDMRELQLQFEKEKMYMNNVINQKNSEIRRFKDELDLMIDEMKQL